MSTKSVIEQYFKAIHGGGWEAFITDDFVFTNSNFDNVARGKAAYVEGAGRFFRATTSVAIRQLVIEGDTACALVRYQLRSPKGNTGVGDVAEILTVRGEKLSSSAIFFDTRAFDAFMAKG